MAISAAQISHLIFQAEMVALQVKDGEVIELVTADAGQTVRRRRRRDVK